MRLNPDSRDMAFLVDVSSSICQGTTFDRDGECENFKMQETFIESVMMTLLDEDSTTGMISWATTIQELYPFMEHVGVEENIDALHENLIYAEGATMTGAMTRSYLDFLSADQERLGAVGREQVAVMITDGVATDDACQHASEFSAVMRGEHTLSFPFQSENIYVYEMSH